MCFRTQLNKSAHEIETRFRAVFSDAGWYAPQEFNGFNFPLTPVITNEQPGQIQSFRWGLIPPWAGDEEIRRYTLNARLETLDRKPSFKAVLHQRCLIIADGFFEWQWLDDKGKKKQKYLLTLGDRELFAFAGLWSQWKNPASGQVANTYTIITTRANELMSRIHNTKQRMPVIPQNEEEWLNGRALIMANDRLVAEPL
ncbi:SOS response-associated peptidase [Thermophagus sp. OGC60D27]|uniref:SOS response-associated peptidase n=1 Tax=Thermophagus sp. OGC60D27 TaxID=3458415 RepID=UPI0040377BAD